MAANMDMRNEMVCESPNPSEERWYGIDYLRALMSFAVVAWHMRLFGTSRQFDAQGFFLEQIEISDILNFNLLLLAVPVFFLISLFLQNEKWMQGQLRLFARLERLLYLYCFWVGMALLLYRLENKLSVIWPDSIAKLGLFVVTGGYSLFYFLFSLILLTIISYAFYKSPPVIHWVLLVVSTSLMWIFPYVVTKKNDCSFLVAFWNPLNFLPYIFISRLIYIYLLQRRDRLYSIHYKIIVWGAFCLCVISAVCEWYWFRDINNFEFNGYAFPSYTRISVVSGAAFLFLTSFYIRHPPPECIRFLSEYSLGIYCLHGFVGWYVVKFMAGMGLPSRELIEFLTVMLVSLMFSVILRRAFSKGLI
jgi:peptidoglycan/LPS O-acetylase OafA/YrhL